LRNFFERHCWPAPLCDICEKGPEVYGWRFNNDSKKIPFKAIKRKCPGAIKSERQKNRVNCSL
jgi:hypothetical protein